MERRGGSRGKSNCTATAGARMLSVAASSKRAAGERRAPYLTFDFACPSFTGHPVAAAMAGFYSQGRSVPHSTSVLELWPRVAGYLGMDELGREDDGAKRRFVGKYPVVVPHVLKPQRLHGRPRHGADAARRGAAAVWPSWAGLCPLGREEAVAHRKMCTFCIL
jgi:hypothetical protein